MLDGQSSPSLLWTILILIIVNINSIFFELMMMLMMILSMVKLLREGIILFHCASRPLPNRPSDGKTDNTDELHPLVDKRAPPGAFGLKAPDDHRRGIAGAERDGEVVGPRRALHAMVVVRRIDVIPFGLLSRPVFFFFFLSL
jgi:hypothetical protein